MTAPRISGTETTEAQTPCLILRILMVRLVVWLIVVESDIPVLYSEKGLRVKQCIHVIQCYFISLITASVLLFSHTSQRQSCIKLLEMKHPTDTTSHLKCQGGIYGGAATANTMF